MPSPTPTTDPRPLVAHVLFRLAVGGLENGVVNLVNHLPATRFRHAIVCLTEATDFRRRIERDDVAVYQIHKRAGHDPAAGWRLYRLFREIRPALVHTRNLGCLEAQIPAWLARVPCRVHGEHGWDVFDPSGDVRKYQLLRRLHAPLIQRFIPLSRELEHYLGERVGIPAGRITRIYNGVDTERFQPGPSSALPATIAGANNLIIGTVGRMHGVKDQLTLAQAFLALHAAAGNRRDRLRLVMIGDGPLRSACQQLLDDAGLAGQCWLPGARDDVADILRALNVFVLPSQAEGISNTLLEAMASGLAVVATAVGGNAELVDDGHTGQLVAPSDPPALAGALMRYLDDPTLATTQGATGRERARQHFSLARMLGSYTEMYSQLLRARGIMD